jgi:purine-nucleoside/S-methyl-5'-thioadenosine phosphorylase / adenosine deaminase
MEAVYRPGDVPDGALVAVSERGVAPPPSPTEILARRFADALGYPGLPIVRGTQVHGARVVVVSEAPPPSAVADAGECDALVTALPGVGLAVQTADCVPLLLAAPEAVAAVHAGWRGAVAGVAARAVEVFLAMIPNRAAARAWIGPAIGPCCYEVGPEVAERFAPKHSRPRAGGKFSLDLPAAIRAQIEAAGFPPEGIMQPNGCTMCGGERFASYRRDGTHAGRMIALVARLR